MRATCWMGPKTVEVMNVPDPKILNQRDAIVRITSTAICGSDLHLYNAFIPAMEPGDVLGHEFMGEVVEVGKEVKNLKVGDRVVVPFPIACGRCWHCEHQMFSLCENSNPNAWMAEKLMGHSPAGIFGYSHLTGGYAGGQAEYARVPFADVGPLKIENGFTDEQVLFLSDIYPTGYMGAEMCDIRPGDVIAVWGCGPVGLFAMKSAFLLGASRVIGIDRFPYRLQMAREKVGAEVLNYEEVNVLEALGVDVRLRPRQAGAEAGTGPPVRHPRGHTGLRQWPHGFGHRRLQRLHRQVPDGLADEPLHHDQERPVSRPPLHETAARTHRQGRD